MIRLKLIISIVIFMVLLLAGAAMSIAAPLTDRLPTMAEVLAGKLYVRSLPKGNYIAWYGDQPFPNVVACVKKQCDLVANKRALAAFLSGPLTKERFNEAMKPFTGDPYKDPALREVWVNDFIQQKELRGD